MLPETNIENEEQKAGKSEDPPTTVTQQNKAGDTTEKEKIDVPKQALESYKEAGNEGEE